MFRGRVQLHTAAILQQAPQTKLGSMPDRRIARHFQTQRAAKLTRIILRNDDSENKLLSSTIKIHALASPRCSRQGQDLVETAGAMQTLRTLLPEGEDMIVV